MVGFLDAHLDIQRLMSGSLGKPTRECLLDGPLVQWSQPSEERVHEAVREVLEVNMAHNSLYSRFRCIVDE
jgi:hypothetical protein